MNHSSLSINTPTFVTDQTIDGIKSPEIKRQVSELEQISTLRKQISSTIKKKKTTFYNAALSDDVGRIAMVSPDAAQLMKELRQSPLDTAKIEWHKHTPEEKEATLLLLKELVNLDMSQNRLFERQ